MNGLSTWSAISSTPTVFSLRAWPGRQRRATRMAGPFEQVSAASNVNFDLLAEYNPLPETGGEDRPRQTPRRAKPAPKTTRGPRAGRKAARTMKRLAQQAVQLTQPALCRGCGAVDSEPGARRCGCFLPGALCALPAPISCSRSRLPIARCRLEMRPLQGLPQKVALSRTQADDVLRRALPQRVFHHLRDHQ